MKDMTSVFGGLQHARENAPEPETTTPKNTAEKQTPEPKAIKPAKAKTLSAPIARLPEANSKRTIGKSRNPEFEPVKILLRKETRKRAERKWADDTGRDFSELIQHLLTTYLG